MAGKIDVRKLGGVVISILCALVITGCGGGGTALNMGATATATKIYNVSDFGAKGDGVADDSSAIEQAMSAASGGGQVVFPCGEFSIQSVSGGAPGERSLLYVKNASDVQLTGQGSCSHLFTTVAQKSVLEFEDSNLITVSDMRITALNAVYVETYGMDGGSAVRFTGVTSGTITQVEVDGSSAGALYLTKGTSNSAVTNNNIHDTYGSGIWEDDCGSANAQNCAPSSPPANNLYDSNTLTNTSLAMTTAMTLDDGGASSHAVVQNNKISWSRSPLPGYNQVHCIQTNNVADVSVLNNTCTSTPYDAIIITTGGGAASQRITIQGNTILSTGTSTLGGSGIVVYDDPTGGGISGFTLASNTITTAASDGIRIYSASKTGGIHDGTIQNNTIAMTDQLKPGTRFGIDIEHSASISANSNAISCNGACIAVGVNVSDSPATTPATSSNQVVDIVGLPLLIR
jgi:hypothetical protein